MWKKFIYFLVGTLFLVGCSSDDNGDNFQISASYFENIRLNSETPIQVLIQPVINSTDSIYNYSYNLDGAGQIQIKDGAVLEPDDEFQTQKLTSTFLFTPTQLGPNYINFRVYNASTNREFRIFYDVIAE
ncbi:hypothetical protein [Aureivirga sp. CE67]|uniref:hypothetical protein n=1 Tax=Aureivirga sp. CE67 TaxID=1788983 RepID=UPI0018C944B1|nr:hypothetical protein [Aureivirga sp. CE67]